LEVDEELLEDNLIEPPTGRETPQKTQQTIEAITGNWVCENVKITCEIFHTHNPNSKFWHRRTSVLRQLAMMIQVTSIWEFG